MPPTLSLRVTNIKMSYKNVELKSNEEKRMYTVKNKTIYKRLYEDIIQTNDNLTLSKRIELFEI